MAGLNRIFILTSSTTVTVDRYAPAEYITFRQPGPLTHQPRVDELDRYHQAVDYPISDRWALGPWPWNTNGLSGAPDSPSGWIADGIGAILWSSAFTRDGGLLAAATAENFAEQDTSVHPRSIGIIDPDTGTVMVVYAISAVYPFYTGTGLGYSQKGNVAVIDKTSPLTAVQDGVDDDDFETGSGSITLGFSTNFIQVPEERVVNEKVWGTIREQGNQAGLLTLSIDSDELTETEQVATIRVRYNLDRTLGHTVVDDLGREWTINGARATDDRHFIDYDVSRMIA